MYTKPLLCIALLCLSFLGHSQSLTQEEALKKLKGRK